MKNEIDLMNEAIEEWRNNVGKGTMYLPKNYNPYLIAAIILSKVYEKDNTSFYSLIIVPTFDDRQLLIDGITQGEDEELNNKFKALLNDNKIKVFTEYYINSKEPTMFNTLVIAINIDKYTFNISKCITKSRFKCVILNGHLSTEDTATLHFDCPCLECFKPSEVLLARTNTPVEEVRIGVDITDDKILDELRKRDEYIKTSLNIFGNFELIKEGFMGNSTMNFSAQQVCERIARENGWDEHLDMSVEINKQLDALYNPNALRERASITYNVVRERNELITDYEGKLEEINKIIKEHPDERFLIISKRSEFATAITDYLNMNSTSQICASCHNKLVPIDMLDSYGKPVLVKSGVSKGKPRMLGAQAQCTKNLQLFRSGKIKAISTNSSPDKDLDMDITSIIITSPSCQSLEEYLYRLSNVRITNPILKLYNIYCTNTSEEKKLNIKMSQNHKIINKNEQNVVFDENCGVIVC